MKRSRLLGLFVIILCVAAIFTHFGIITKDTGSKAQQEITERRPESKRGIELIGLTPFHLEENFDCPHELDPPEPEIYEREIRTVDATPVQLWSTTIDAGYYYSLEARIIGVNQKEDVQAFYHIAMDVLPECPTLHGIMRILNAYEPYPELGATFAVLPDNQIAVTVKGLGSEVWEWEVLIAQHRCRKQKESP